MAQQGIHVAKEKLCCSICLDLLKDPVTIPCGHSHCMNCIKIYWDAEEQKESNCCPQCRQTFALRPALVKNTVLADLVEDLKRTGLQAAPADTSRVEREDVVCDVCAGKKLQATKSCLQCLVSYCDQHLQPHYESPALAKHKLVAPFKNLQENICSRHNEVMKIFCRTDQQCICYLCYMDEHKGHDTVSAAAERTEKQREVGARREKIQQTIQDRESDGKILGRRVEAIKGSADKAVTDSERVCSEARQQIRARQKAEVSRVREAQEKLEQEIAELRRRDTELEQLSHTKDQIQFLHSFALLSHVGEATDSRGFQMVGSEDVEAGVSSVRDKLKDILSEKWTKPELEPETRDELSPSSCQVRLDINTAHPCITVEDESNAKYYHYNTTGRIHPDRFTDWYQVLCRENLTGSCYWDVKWTGREVFIAVAYKSMSRAGPESAFGNNSKSWALQCFRDGYEFRHNSISTSVSGPFASTVRVVLDYKAGTLAFYSVSAIKTLLYIVQTRFTQPLCPGFGMYSDGVSVQISSFLKTKE